MKKTWVVVLTVAFGLALLGTSVYAQWGMGCGGPGGYGYAGSGGKPVDVNAVKAFQKETLPLRDEMMVKRVEIRNEYAKEKPDEARIATLQKEMIDLRAKIKAAADKQGLSAAGFGRGYGPRAGGAGCGGWGRGGQGYDRGPGSGNCPMW